MTTFSNGVKPTSVVHDDTIAEDPKDKPCRGPCFVVNNIPTFHPNLADGFTDEELLPAIENTLRDLDPPTFNMFSYDENVQAFCNMGDALAAGSKMRIATLDAAEDYFKNRFPNEDINVLRVFIDVGTNVGRMAVLQQVPDCCDLDDVVCKDDEEIKDALTETYCKESPGNSGSTNIECIKYLAGRADVEIKLKENSDATFEPADNCDDCAGYEVCCDSNYQAKILPLGATVSNTFTNCASFGKDEYKAALAEYKARQQNVGYIRVGERGQGVYVCTRVSKNCVPDGVDVYDDIKACQNLTPATTQPTVTPTPYP